MSRQQGMQFEQIAARFLAKQGLKILKQNFQVYRGELDLILLDQEQLVFAEVKYRKNARFGSAAEMVTLKKQKHLILTAEVFLKKFPEHMQRPSRFDVIAIDGTTSHYKIDWIKNAFQIT